MGFDRFWWIPFDFHSVYINCYGFWCTWVVSNLNTVDFLNLTMFFWAETLAHWNPTSWQQKHSLLICSGLRFSNWKFEDWNYGNWTYHDICRFRITLILFSLILVDLDNIGNPTNTKSKTNKTVKMSKIRFKPYIYIYICDISVYGFSFRVY